MTAYGAVISLKNTIHYILHSSHFTLVDDPSLQIIQQAYNELQPLQEILERLDKTRTSRSRKKVNALDGRIKDKIWEFEDELESLLYQQIHSQVDGDGGRRRRVPLLFSIDVSSFIEKLKDMEKEYIYELENMPQEPISTAIGFDSGLTKSRMIGLSDQFQEIKGDIMRIKSWNNIVYKIVGTAGIGKTTLAKEVYEDADIVRHFDCRAWVTVTRSMVDEGPHFDEVVQGIVAQLCGGDTLIQGHDYLEGKKCLIVLDDVWEEEVYYCLRKPLPNIKKGMIFFLITTRGMDLLAHTTKEMRFLTDKESKDLLCHKVFGGKDLCPDQLGKAAAKIAKKCEGLPLMIVAVANILSRSQNREPDYWNEVAEERNSVFTDAYNEILEVLFPSYDYLPQYLKMPFLFMGVFPRDYETPLSKLMNMLNVEGWFLDTNKKQSLKDSVSHCLDQLCMSRYLVLFKRKSVAWYGRSYDSIYKTCWLHSSWRYVCRVEARKNKLYHALHTLVDSSEQGQRGLCLQNNILFGIEEFRDSVRLNSASFARSLLFFGPYHQYPTPIDVGFKFLRELDALQLRFYTFPEEILTLVQLKYLALTCNGELPPTISKLFNLRVLIVHPHMSIRHCGAPSYVPIQIWDMKELEHIEILGRSLRVPNQFASLGKLKTLVGVNASICTILELPTRIPHIRKLGLQIELTPYENHSDLLSCLACISTLGSLKTLKCSIINPMISNGYIFPMSPSSLMLPHWLTKLHLSGMGFPWEYMDVIGFLPFLQVLKLRSYAFRGSNWEAKHEGMFPRLRFLLIEDTDLVCLTLFPTLTRLSIKHCYKLKKIHWPPRDDEDRKIELVDCNPLAMTWAKKVKPRGYSLLDVTISSSFEEKPVTINFKSSRDNIDIMTRLMLKIWSIKESVKKAFAYVNDTNPV